MTPTLMTTWAEHDAALDRVLDSATRQLSIFDPDLVRLGLDRPQRSARLRELLRNNPKHGLCVIVQDGSQIAARFPRLIALLAEYSHNFKLAVAGEHLAHLADAMVIADDRHALIRFHRDHARCKLIADDGEATRPYLARFLEILSESPTSVSARPPGL